MKYILYPRFTVLYVALCLIVMAAGHLQLTWTYYLTKPLVMLMVMVFFRLQTSGTQNRMFRNLMVAGFIFSAAGDFLLMFTEVNETYFIAGLVAFLFAHFCYTGGFISQIFQNRPWNQHWGQLAVSTMIVVYGAEFFILNRSGFGSLTLPVMIYCAAITAMGVAAVMRDRYKNANGYFRVVLGAVFFVISDSLLATNKFIAPIESAGLLILGTYFFAQYLIATGCMVDIQKPVLKKPDPLYETI